MFIGIDLGTSAVKIVLVDGLQRLVAAAEAALHPRQPRPLWSEDDPDAWWAATAAAMDRLSQAHAEKFSEVRAIGLSGQMHGALLLGEDDRPVRPAILWNDGRAAGEAAALAADHVELQRALGVRPMPGFTGPKILWLCHHEPETMARVRHLLLPKDYLRLKLTGERATDVSDAAGTWLLDQQARRWSRDALTACRVDQSWLPNLVESTAVAGHLRTEWAERWGLAAGTPVSGGGGDTAVGGVGIGAVGDGQGFISLGTSGQVFAAAESHAPNPERLVHAFCHAVPDRWYRMAALLNGASPLAAVARWTGRSDIGELLAEVEAAYVGPSDIIALPYLFGERTPHNDPYARAALIGMTGSTRCTDLTQAMIEAVAYSLADGVEVLEASGASLERLGFIGGGARSPFWGRIIAAVTGKPLICYDAADRGPAFGAARLARLAVSGETVADVVRPPAILSVIEPTPHLHDLYRPRLEAFRATYRALKPLFGSAA